MPDVRSRLGRSPRSGFSQNRANLYIVLAPPEPVAAKITTVANDIKQLRKLKGKLRREETFHVTLVTLPRLQVPPDPTDRIIVAISSVLSHMQFEPIEITFDRIESFDGGARRPIVLTSNRRNEALFELEQRLHEKLHIPRLPGLPFKPHLTMIWDRVGIPKLELEEPIRWTAEKPSLIFSHVGKSKYDWFWPEVSVSR
jgi:2'-5' RNA ligase